MPNSILQLLRRNKKRQAEQVGWVFVQRWGAEQKDCLSATALSATRGLAASRFALSTCLLTYGGADWGAGEGWRLEGEGVLRRWRRRRRRGREKGWLGAREVGWVQARRRECTDCPLCSWLMGAEMGGRRGSGLLDDHWSTSPSLYHHHTYGNGWLFGLRVNHTGVICAQSFYRRQALLPKTKGQSCFYTNFP